MQYSVTIEEFEGQRRIGGERLTADGWEEVWAALSGLIDAYDSMPDGMEDWNEGGCVLNDHACKEDPDGCRAYAKEAAREWVRAALEDAEIHSVGFHFSGQKWATLTAF